MTKNNKERHGKVSDESTESMEKELYKSIKELVHYYEQDYPEPIDMMIEKHKQLISKYEQSLK